MKRFLQGVLGVIVVAGLAIAVIELVRNAPNSSPLLDQTTSVSNQSQPIELETATPVPQNISSGQKPSITNSEIPSNVTTTIETQHIPEPTPTFELNYDTLKVVSVEEINLSPDQSVVGTLSNGERVPVGRKVDWSPDGQRALVARELTHSHILSRSNEETYAPLGATDLWVWDQEAGQEIRVTDKAHYWDWAPDSRAVVYLTSVGDEGLEGELHTFDLNTKTDQKIVDTDITQAYPGPFWLSSGEIVYMDEARLWIIQPDGSNRRLLNSLQVYRDEAVGAGREEYSYAPDKVGGRLYLSPDETKLAYITLPDEQYPGSQLWIADLTGDNRVKMEGNTFFDSWAFDGAFFLYGKKLGDGYFFDLWMAKADGSSPRRLIDVVEWGQEIARVHPESESIPGEIGVVALSPDNRLVVFSELSYMTLWLLDISTGKWRFLYKNDELLSPARLMWLTNDELMVSFISSPFRADQRHFLLNLED